MKISLGAKIAVCPAPVWCIGSYDMEGRPNVMTASWVGIACSSPPCVTVSLRKATCTYDNIMHRKAYTINVPSRQFAAAVDYFGMVSGRDTDKFEKTGLTPVKGSYVDAPYIDEFSMILECRVIHTYEIGIHTQFIGEIMDTRVDESILDSEGHPDIQKINPFIFVPDSRKYCGLGQEQWKAFNTK